jgi:hypothetical protein
MAVIWAEPDITSADKIPVSSQPSPAWAEISPMDMPRGIRLMPAGSPALAPAQKGLYINIIP